MSLLEAINNDDLTRVKELLTRSSFTNQIKSEGELLLGAAALVENPEIIKILIEAGASPDWEGLGKELLETAIMETHIELFKAIIDAGANINTIDEDGNTPLMSAAAIGCLEVVKLLVENNAEINAVGKYGDFALLSAAINDRQEVFDYLVSLTSPELREKVALPSRSMS